MLDYSSILWSASRSKVILALIPIMAVLWQWIPLPCWLLVFHSTLDWRISKWSGTWCRIHIVDQQRWNYISEILHEIWKWDDKIVPEKTKKPRISRSIATVHDNTWLYLPMLWRSLLMNQGRDLSTCLPLLKEKDTHSSTVRHGNHSWRWRLMVAKEIVR